MEAEPASGQSVQRYYDPVLGKFVSTDAVAVDTVTGWNFCRYCYAANNPYKFTDPDGRSIWTKLIKLAIKGGDIAATTAGLVSDAQTVMNPNASFGERAIAAVSIASEALPVSVGDAKDVVNGVRRIANGADNASDAGNAVRRQTGSYTNTHESGMTYDGKGSRARSQESGRRVEAETGDKHVATDWTPAGGSRDAFKDESRRLDSHGGPQSSSNHNKIESPGKKMREMDEQ